MKLEMKKKVIRMWSENKIIRLRFSSKNGICEHMKKEAGIPETVGELGMR